MAFKEASKSLAKAKILLTGPSGSGKTFSSLRFARGLGGKVGVIDTENNSASLYADQFKGWKYFVDAISPPYTAQKYFNAIDDALAAKFDVLIIDSITHLWAGEGGLLQQKEGLDSRGGNSYTNWGSITKLHEQFKSKVLHSNIHIICTVRSKQEYVMEQNDKGKTAPKKVGLAPVQREGLEYEFTTVFDIGMDHQFMVSKDRTNLFDGVIATITEDTGSTVKSWLADEVVAPEIETPPVQAQQPPPQKEPAHASAKTSKAKPKITPKNNSAPSEQPKSVPKVQSSNFDPGDYVILFGEKWGLKNKKINELGETLIRRAITWVDEEDAKGKNLHSSLKDFRQYAKDFLASMGCQAEGPPPEPEDGPELPKDL